MTEGVSLGELYRMTDGAVRRIDAVADRLESGQFVRTDTFVRSERELNRIVADQALEIHDLQSGKASKDALRAVEVDVSVRVEQKVFDDLVRRVVSLESTLSWVTRIVVGFVIAGILAYVFSQNGGSP